MLHRKSICMRARARFEWVCGAGEVDERDAAEDERTIPFPITDVFMCGALVCIEYGCTQLAMHNEIKWCECAWNRPFLVVFRFFFSAFACSVCGGWRGNGHGKGVKWETMQPLGQSERIRAWTFTSCELRKHSAAYAHTLPHRAQSLGAIVKIVHLMLQLFAGFLISFGFLFSAFVLFRRLCSPFAHPPHRPPSLDPAHGFSPCRRGGLCLCPLSCSHFTLQLVRSVSRGSRLYGRGWIHRKSEQSISIVVAGARCAVRSCSLRQIRPGLLSFLLRLAARIAHHFTPPVLMRSHR